MKVRLLLLPESSGNFHDHLQQVGYSLKRELQNSYAVQLPAWNEAEPDENTAVLIVFQSQGRPGDEFPHVLPPKLRKGGQLVLVAVVQDDEWTSCSKDIVPDDVTLVSVVNLHVVPGQHQLHGPGPSLCPRNKETVQQIARELGLPAKSDGPIYLFWPDTDSLPKEEKDDIKSRLEEGGKIEIVNDETGAEALLFCLNDDDDEFDKKRDKIVAKYSRSQGVKKFILATVHTHSEGENHKTVGGFRGWSINRLRVRFYKYVDDQHREAMKMKNEDDPIKMKNEDDAKKMKNEDAVKKITEFLTPNRFAETFSRR